MSDFVPSLAEPKDSRSPLIRFRGVLKEFKSEQSEAREGRAPTMRVAFNFTDVEVLESHEPYPFPIATISLSYSERADTVWDAWRKSVVKLLPSRDINELVGKQQEWAFIPAQLRRPDPNDESERPKWTVQTADAWQVVALEGVSAESAGKNLNQTLIELADGKTSQEFYTELFTRADLKKLPGFEVAIEQASNRKLLENFEAGGLIKLGTDGKWVKA